MIARALFGIALLVPLAAAAQPQGITRERLEQDTGFRSFLRNLQGAIRTDNRDAVLRLIEYPLRVTTPNASGTYRRSRFYRTPTAVRADYGRIFTRAVRCTIITQRYEMLSGDSHGFMIGLGTVWFDRTCPHGRCHPPGPVRIMTINP